MLIASQLAVVLQAVLADYDDLLQELNDERVIEGMEQAPEAESVKRARELVNLQADQEMSLRYDMDPERSRLIAEIEVAEEGKDKDQARSELKRYDSKHPLEAREAPSSSQFADYLRMLAAKFDPHANAYAMLRLAAREFDKLPRSPTAT